MLAVERKGEMQYRLDVTTSRTAKNCRHDFTITTKRCHGHRSPRRQACFENRTERASVLDCDGKRSATPLSALEVFPAPE
jgi:hypothetical protein